MNIRMKKLGKSGIPVTQIGLGLWSAGGDFWGKTEDQNTLDLIDFALDSGVNFFDTADVYSDGRSEELLGEAMKGRREKFIVATKIGWKNFNEEKGQSGYDTVEKLIAGVETNLKRLQTDFIDLLQCHIDYQDATMNVFLEGFQKLQQEGKIRAYGVSTSDFEYLKAFNADGGTASLQIDYSILNRTPEKEIFPYCLENNIGVIIRGPLAMGILTGKFSPDHQFEPSDFRNRWLDNPDEKEIFLNDLAKVEKLKALASETRSLTQLAIQFVLQHKAVTTVIPGAKTRDQFDETAGEAALEKLSQEEYDYIGNITPVGGGRKIWPA